MGCGSFTFVCGFISVFIFYLIFFYRRMPSEQQPAADRANNNMAIWAMIIVCFFPIHWVRHFQAFSLGKSPSYFFCLYYYFVVFIPLLPYILNKIHSIFWFKNIKKKKKRNHFKFQDSGKLPQSFNVFSIFLMVLSFWCAFQRILRWGICRACWKAQIAFFTFIFCFCPRENLCFFLRFFAFKCNFGIFSPEISPNSHIFSNFGVVSEA